MRDFHIKEKPLQGLSGLAGGATGLRMSGVAVADPGQQEYTSEGTYYWTVPAGVTEVSVVCIGGGGAGSCSYSGTGNRGGGGGACSYKNNIAVSGTITVVVGSGAAPGSGNDGGDSYFLNASTVMAKGGKTATWDTTQTGGKANDCVGDGAYNGGNGGTNGNGGQYGQGSSSDGGSGGGPGSATPGNPYGGGTGGAAGNGGGGGGGGMDTSGCPAAQGGSASNNGEYIGGGGGGGSAHTGVHGHGGGGGGGGNLGTDTGTSPTDGNDSAYSNCSYGGSGGDWGGGGGTSKDQLCNSTLGAGGSGAVRIIWGDADLTREFPSTNVGDVSS